MRRSIIIHIFATGYDGCKSHQPFIYKLLNEHLMKQNNSKRKTLIPSGVWCITTVVVLFGYLGMVMGVPNMLNTIMLRIWKLKFQATIAAYSTLVLTHLCL